MSAGSDEPEVARQVGTDSSGDIVSETSETWLPRSTLTGSRSTLTGSPAMVNSGETILGLGSPRDVSKSETILGLGSPRDVSKSSKGNCGELILLDSLAAATDASWTLPPPAIMAAPTARLWACIASLAPPASAISSNWDETAAHNLDNECWG